MNGIIKNHLIFASLSLMYTHVTFTMENQKCQKIETHLFDDYWDKEDYQVTELQSIEQTQTSSTPSQTKNPSDNKLNETLAIINETINKKYVAKGIWGREYQLDSSTLQEKDFFDIIKIIHQKSSTCDCIQTHAFIQKLYSQNKYFKQALNHFIRLVRKNIDNVTYDTLDIFLDTDMVQSIYQLNNLPMYIKETAIANAYHIIEHSYNIILTGHKNIINCFDIHADTHRAATSSYDKTLRLWDLTTGKCIRVFPGDDNFVHCMNFSENGSCLATAANYTDNSSVIAIWDIQSAQILCDYRINMRINLLRYGDKTLMACNRAQTNPKIIMLLIDENCSMYALEEMVLPAYEYISRHKVATWKHLYKTKFPDDYHREKKSTLSVTKLNCRNLYLYERAITNNPLNFNLEKIDQSEFTEYEKNRLHKLLIAEQTKGKLAQKLDDPSIHF